MRQKLIELQRETDGYAFVVGDIHIFVSEMSRSSRHKIIKELMTSTPLIKLDTVNWILINHFIQQHDTHSFQIHVEHSQR